LDKRKIEVIIHVTNENFAVRLIKSLKKIIVPKNFSVEVQPLTGDEKFFIYETAMVAGDAKYKIYLNEQIIITDEYFLFELLKIFESDEKIGVVGTKNFFSEHIIDGIFFATQYDLPWRHDLFSDNFFGLQAQCMEFKRAGYKIFVGGDWISFNKENFSFDEVSKQKFLDEYSADLLRSD